MIIHVVRFFSPHIGGNENQAYRLLQELSITSSFNYEVVTYRYSSNLPKRERLNNIEINRVGFLVDLLTFLRKFKNKRVRSLSGLLEELDVFFSIYYFLRKHHKNIELLHVHQATSIAFAAYLIFHRYHIPYLVKDATTDGLSYWDNFPCGKRIQKRILSTAYWVAMTDVIRGKLYERGVAVNRIFMIPNGFSAKENSEVGKYIENRRILFIGNFDQGKIKGLDLLIKAFIILYKRDSNITLWVAGRGDKCMYIDFLEKAGVPRSAYSFIGEIKNVISLYQECNVFVLSSRIEGFSNSLMEAVAYGIPCVATNVSSAKELIEDGYNGRIVPINDCSALAEGISFCFEHKSEVRKWIERSELRIKNNFTFDIIAKKYIRVYELLFDK